MKHSALERYLLTLLYHEREGKEFSRGPLVAISRDYGAGAREVGPRLAKRLTLPFYDQEIIDGIINVVEGNPDLMRRLDESAPPGMLERLFHRYGNIPSSDEYARALVEIILVIASRGGVVVGRGVHLIASVQNIYRVYLYASEETCVDRVAKRRGLNYEVAATQWRQIMAGRRDYLKHYFGHTHDAFGDFDLCINTEHIDEFESVVDIIIAGLQAVNLIHSISSE